jgi:hypothetical protein
MKLWLKALAAVMLVGGAGCGSDADPSGTPNQQGDAQVETQPDAAVALGGAPGGGTPSGSMLTADASEPAVIEIDAGPPKVCADVETTPVRSVPSVTFLVDGSGSMDCVYPEDPACDCDGQLFKKCTAQGALSRWQALSQALLGNGGEAGLVDTLGGSIRFGLWIYNNAPGALLCPGYPAKVAPELNQAAQLKAAFPAKAPGYNTPTARALAELTAALPDAATVKAKQLGPQKIVLATDGQPFTCQDPVKLDKPALDYDAVLAATQVADAKDVDLYVMSLAPAAGDFAAHLNAVAKQGGSDHAYTPANKGELSAALDDIIASAISCTVTLNGSVERPEDCRGRATLGAEELRCGDADGFSIRDAMHIELRGEACRRFKHEPGIPLKMTFPCDGFQLQ